MKFEINPNISIAKASNIEEAVTLLVENLDSANLNFLAEQSKKPNVNAKLAAKKGLIRTFL